MMDTELAIAAEHVTHDRAGAVLVLRWACAVMLHS